MSEHVGYVPDKERAWGFLGAIVLNEQTVKEVANAGRGIQARRRARALSIALADRVLDDPHMAKELPGLFRDLREENPLAALTVLGVVRATYTHQERKNHPFGAIDTSKNKSRLALGLPVRGSILSPASYSYR